MTHADLLALTDEARLDLVLRTLREELSAALDIDEDYIESDMTLVEFGLDSLRLLAMVDNLHERFGFRLPPEVLPVQGTLDDVAGALATALGTPDPVAALRRDQVAHIEDQIRQDLHLLPGTAEGTARVPREEVSAPGAVFLTGGTGFVGAYLLAHLLEATSATVHCLVRADSADAGRRRLEQNLERFGLREGLDVARICPEVGDLSRPHFGLSPDRFQALAEAVAVVYHNGAMVHLTKPYEEMRGPNVAGVRTALHLAGTGRIKPIAVISSVGLFDTPELEELEAITEEDGPSDPSLLPNGYIQSKWVGERLVALAAQRGLPAASLRVGHVIGHGVSEDMAGRVAAACLAAAQVPRLVQPVDYVSPHYVAQAIVALPRQLDAFGGTYHLANPVPFTADDEDVLIASSGLPVEVLPAEQWVASLREAATRDPEHPMAPALDALAEPAGGRRSFLSQVLARPRIDCSRTVAAVAPLSLPCPTAREILVDVLSGLAS